MTNIKMGKNKNYIVAGCKSWNKNIFDHLISSYCGNWFYVNTKEDLAKKTKALNPRYVFFLHWSYIVPDGITKNYECVCFHMTDVPYGRGGSPLQNLIVRGQRKTKLSALQMVGELDAGPVYSKEDLSLEGSSAEEIYIRATELSARMIKRIMENEIKPKPQNGEVLVFKRRRPEESDIPKLPDTKTLFDFIRMLDAKGYPNAFLNYKGFRMEFSRASLYDNRVIANVEITKTEEKK